MVFGRHLQLRFTVIYFAAPDLPILVPCEPPPPYLVSLLDPQGRQERRVYGASTPPIGNGQRFQPRVHFKIQIYNNAVSKT